MEHTFLEENNVEVFVWIWNLFAIVTFELEVCDVEASHDAARGVGDLHGKAAHSKTEVHHFELWRTFRAVKKSTEVHHVLVLPDRLLWEMDFERCVELTIREEHGVIHCLHGAVAVVVELCACELV